MIYSARVWYLVADFGIPARDMVVNELTARGPTVSLPLQGVWIWVLWQVPTILDSRQKKIMREKDKGHNLSYATFRVITRFPFCVSLHTTSRSTDLKDKDSSSEGNSQPTSATCQASHLTFEFKFSDFFT